MTASAMLHHVRSTCRLCGATELTRVLSFGRVPLANAFPHQCEDPAQEPRYPLDVYFCERCSLVQLRDVIDPHVLFRDYIYVSGTSDALAEHHARYARDIVEVLDLRPGAFVVEVASNDGSLLGCLARYGVNGLGIEPSVNIAAQARARGIRTLEVFFNSAVAREVRQSFGPAKAIIANNVLAHVDDPTDFLGGCKELLEPDGLVVVEVPNLRDLMAGLEYDTIYHEHLSYFTAGALLRLAEAAGLSVVRLQRVEIHGGSLRMWAGRRERFGEHAAQARALAAADAGAGLASRTAYKLFAARVAEHRAQLRDLLEQLRSAGRTIAGYGAPAKATTLLNYCGIGSDLISFTVDKNPLKVGRVTPGTHIPILPVSTILERQPDYLLVLAWNFAAEVLGQQQAYRARGGNFIIPVPEARIS
jgi:cyclopropane fatty-acyl-phospholipid synthase-like methyltransferase